MSDTPRCDAHAATISIAWSGNETDSMRCSVYMALMAWSDFARTLEREIYSEIQGHADIVRLAEEMAQRMVEEKKPKGGLSQAFVDRAQHDHDAPTVVGRPSFGAPLNVKSSESKDDPTLGEAPKKSPAKKRRR